MAIRYPLQQYAALASTALTATAAGAAFTLPYTDFDSLVLSLNVTAASGTTPTMDMYLQTTTDGGTTWFDVVHFAQVTAALTNPSFAVVPAGDAARYVGAVGSKTIAASTMGLPLLSNTMRIAYTIAGTTPSFTTVVTLYVSTANHGL